MKADTTDGHSIVYEQGQQVIASRKKYSGVGVILPFEAIQAGNPIDLYMLIVNYDSIPFNFSAENVLAKCGQNTIYIYHPEEVLQEQGKRTDISNENLTGLTAADIKSLAPQIAKHNQRKQKELSKFASYLLRAQTIAPNNNHGGIIRMGFPSCRNKIELSIIAGKDTHLFKFNIIEK
jgi:hypothetical protein